MRKFVHKILEPSDRHDDFSHYFDVFIISLIFLNILAIILASEKFLFEKYELYFDYFELISVIIFSIEYSLRLWACVENEKYKHPIKGRIKFIFTAMALIDLIAILPFFLPFIGLDFRFLRIMRLFRVLRLLKLARYSNAFNLIKNVILDKKEDLIVTTALISIILIVVSTLMYYVEGDVQPEHFSSISASLWWGICTLTTVGYGDVVPITGMGKLLGGLISMLGIGLIALPTGILASGYTEQMMKRKNHHDNNS